MGILHQPDPGALMICSIIFAVRSTPMQLGQLRDGDWLGIGCMAVGLGSLIAMLEEGQRDDLLGSFGAGLRLTYGRFRWTDFSPFPSGICHRL
jgi:hypothetical protein